VRTRPTRTWSAGSRTLAGLLLAVVVPPAATLAWLGTQLLQQDRSLLAQREQDRRAAALTSAVHALDAALADAERRLPDGAVPDGMVRFRFGPSGVEADPADRVAWLPAPPPMRAADSAPLKDAEAFEFRGDGALALAANQRFTGASNPAIRTAALVATARIYSKGRQWDEALRAYRLLVDVRGVAVAGAPADLQARRAMCGVLGQSRRAEAFAREALALEGDLVSGRWALDRPAWELTAADVEGWTGHPLPINPERNLLSAVAATLWDERQRGVWPLPAQTGRRLVASGDTSVTIVWRIDGARTAVLAIPPSVLRTWTAHGAEGGAGTMDRLSLVTTTGDVLSGLAPAADAATIKRQPSDTFLPWTVVLSPGSSSPLAGELAARRRLLSAGLAAILVFFAGAAYFLWRVVRRELAVVRQQTEFVATVSHEFRTPLTSLRHVAELLQESDDLPADRRRAFYQALGRNTERLHRLVESLLDFFRMEGGKKPYDLQPLDAGELARRVVAEFQQDVGSLGVTVATVVDTRGPLSVRADAAALTHGLWNLLDNAVKYSLGASTVHVSVAPHPAGVAIAVRDEGPGIPAQEQKEIFDRFVRGRQAVQLGIKGTGLGLAIAYHIVSAHGGTIELESEEGAGSTFRIVLPALN
jgi:signal transduction histidine kinase